MYYAVDRAGRGRVARNLSDDGDEGRPHLVYSSVSATSHGFPEFAMVAEGREERGEGRGERGGSKPQ